MDHMEDQLAYDHVSIANYEEEIQDVFKRCPDDVKIALFPRTMDHPVYSTLIEGFNRDPKRIVAKNEDLTLEGVSHYHMAVETLE